MQENKLTIDFKANYYYYYHYYNYYFYFESFSTLASDDGLPLEVE